MQRVSIFIVGLLGLMAAWSGGGMLAMLSEDTQRSIPSAVYTIGNIVFFGSIGLMAISGFFIVLWMVYGRHSIRPVDVFFWMGFSLRDSQSIAAKITNEQDALELIPWRKGDSVGEFYDRGELMKALQWRRIRSGPPLRAALKRRKTDSDDIADTAELILLGFTEKDMLGASHAELLKLHDGGVTPDQIRTFYDHGIDSDFGPSIINPASLLGDFL